MRRKLVKQGSSTLMVSLPSKWIHSNKLDKGKEINLEIINNNILISSSSIETKKEAILELKSPTETFIRTLITNTYRRGFDRIKINFESEKQFKILNDTIKTRLIGFEIIKKEQSSCIVENITEPSQDQFENILRKIFYSIHDLFETTERRFQQQSSLEEIEAIEERIQKYDNFCRRVISKSTNKDATLLWTFLALIIHAQRELYLLNRILGRKHPSKAFLSLLKDAKSLAILIQKAYTEKNPAFLEDIHSLEKEFIYKNSYELLKSSRGEESIITYHLASAIRQFYLSSSPLSGLILS